METRKLIFTGKKEGNLIKLPFERVSVRCEICAHTSDHKRDYETLEIVPEYYSVSISGVVGIHYDECEQIIMGRGPDDVSDALKEIFLIWNKYHLNDMQPGTKRQMKALEGFKRESNFYGAASKKLSEMGLNPDGDYKFGSEWLLKQISENEIKYIKSLFGGR